MKKIFFALAAIAAVTLVSCKGGNEQSSAAESSAQVTTDSISAEDFEKQLNTLVQEGDTAGIQQLITTTQTTAGKLSATDPTLAEQFLAKVQEVVEKNKETLSGLGVNATNIITKIKEIPTNVTDAAASLVSNANDSAASAAASAVAGATETVESAKNAANSVKENAEAVKSAVENAPANAKQAVEKAKDNAREKAANAAANAASNAVNNVLGGKKN